MDYLMKILGMVALPAVLAGAIALAPVNVTTDGGHALSLQMNAACVQGVECRKRLNYICGTPNADHIDYECTQGCL